RRHVRRNLQLVACSAAKETALRILKRAEIESRGTQLFRRRIEAEVADASRVHVEVVGPLERKGRLGSYRRYRYRPAAVGPKRRGVGEQRIHQPRVRVAGGCCQGALRSGVGLEFFSLLDAQRKQEARCRSELARRCSPLEARPGSPAAATDISRPCLDLRPPAHHRPPPLATHPPP